MARIQYSTPDFALRNPSTQVEGGLARVVALLEESTSAQVVRDSRTRRSRRPHAEFVAHFGSKQPILAALREPRSASPGRAIASDLARPGPTWANEAAFVEGRSPTESPGRFARRLVPNRLCRFPFEAPVSRLRPSGVADSWTFRTLISEFPASPGQATQPGTSSVLGPLGTVA